MTRQNNLTYEDLPGMKLCVSKYGNKILDGERCEMVVSFNDVCGIQRRFDVAGGG